MVTYIPLLLIQNVSIDVLNCRLAVVLHVIRFDPSCMVRMLATFAVEEIQNTVSQMKMHG